MTSLTDRYVHATLRSVPEGRRDEIGRELRASIDDMIEARAGDGEEPDAAERAVLTELGDPALLSSRYTDTGLHLIGPRYFLVWKRLTINLLCWVPALAAIAIGVFTLLEDGNDLGDVIGPMISTAIGAIVHIGFWTTLAFAILERLDVDAGIPEWSVDRLSEVQLGRQITLVETATNIALLALLAGVIVLQHVRSWVQGPDGDDVPVLDPDLWSFWLPLLLVVIAGMALLSLATYRVGHWTYPLAAVNAVLAMAFAVVVVWLVWDGAVINPAFERALDLDGEVNQLTATGVAVGTAIAVAWGIGDAFWKARKARHDEPATAFEGAARVG